MAIPIGIRKKHCIEALVNALIAVVVDAIADFDSARVRRAVGIVTVVIARDKPIRRCTGQGGVCSNCTVPIAVCVLVKMGQDILVDTVIAVIVDAVAEFDGFRVDVRGSVVAVPSGGHIPTQGFAGGEDKGGTAMPVPIIIKVPGGHDIFVHRPIAVIVRLVADLSGIGVNIPAGIIAVFTIGDMATGKSTGLHALVRITKAIGVRIHVKDRGDVLVHRLIAVIVRPVTDLDGIGVNIPAGVVAVLAVGGVTNG
jgi:hypothetical protein